MSTASYYVPDQTSSFMSSKMGGTDAQAALVKKREREYNQFYRPIAESIRADATRELDFGKAAAEGARGARLFDVGWGAYQRQQRGLGVAPTAGEENRRNLRRTISEVDARTRNLDAQEERRTLAQIAATDQYSDLYANAGSVYNTLAGMEANRKAQSQGQSAQNSSDAMGAAGLAIGVASMFI